MQALEKTMNDSYNTLQEKLKTIDKEMSTKLEEAVNKTDETMNDYIISVRRLTKCFGDFTAVNRISFDVQRGEIFGFLGANGAGKTTAMRMLCGLSYPTSGSGTVAGWDVMREGEQIKRHIGYMSQKFSLYALIIMTELCMLRCA